MCNWSRKQPSAVAIVEDADSDATKSPVKRKLMQSDYGRLPLVLVVSFKFP